MDTTPLPSPRSGRWSGPPLALQITALLLGGLVVAQLVTLALTLLLPPEPPQQYELSDIARALRGDAVQPRGARPLERTLQAEAPAPGGPGWLTSERSRHDLAALLQRDDAGVRLFFYTPLPFAGTTRPPPRGDTAANDDDDAPRLRLADWTLAQAPRPAPAPPGSPSQQPVLQQPPAGALPPPLQPPPAGAPPGPATAAARPAPLPPPGTTAVTPRIWIAPMPVPPGDVGVAPPPGGTAPGATAQGGTAVPAGAPANDASVWTVEPAQATAPRDPAAPWQTTTRGQTAAIGQAAAPGQTGAPGQTSTPAQSATPGQQPPQQAQAQPQQPSQTQQQLPLAQARQSQPPVPLAPPSTRPAVPSPVPPPPPPRPPATALAAGRDAALRNATAPSALASAVASARPPAAQSTTTANATPAPRRATAATPSSSATADPNASAPPPVARPPTTAASPDITDPRPRTQRNLFGLAPAPFVEGDFIAALRVADGWAVVQPLPEPFPNAWQRRVLLWFGFAAAVVAPLGWLFSRRLVRPMAGFARAAEQLGRDPTAPVLALAGPAEVGRAAQAFNRMQSRLRSFVDDRTAMIGAISHDLRTPLTRLRFRIEDAPDALRDGMLHDVGEMERMIHSVLAFLRDASEPGARERLDLASVVADVVDDAVFTGRRVTLAGNAAAPVEVDAIGMRRLLDNLIENAVKYGDGAEVRLRTDADDAVVEVADRGPGLAPDEIERVFEPFYRGAAARASDKAGSGLGLAVCRSIARAHGGDVRLRRREPGLVAELRLPLVAAPAFSGRGT